MTPIAPLNETFLCETLASQRGVSRHTRDSYALIFREHPALKKIKNILQSDAAAQSEVGLKSRYKGTPSGRVAT